MSNQQQGPTCQHLLQVLRVGDGEVLSCVAPMPKACVGTLRKWWLCVGADLQAAGGASGSLQTLLMLCGELV